MHLNSQRPMKQTQSGRLLHFGSTMRVTIGYKTFK